MKIEIDTAKWSTPGNLAKALGVSKQVINNWITRGKIRSWFIKELNLNLVDKTEANSIKAGK